MADEVEYGDKKAVSVLHFGSYEEYVSSKDGNWQNKQDGEY